MLLLGGICALVLFSASQERELWKVVSTDGSAIVLTGQQRWFGLTGIHLVRQHRGSAGQFVRAKVVGRCGSWSEAKAKANSLHRQAYGGDSQLYFEEHIRPLVAVIAPADELIAYEGLPHQHWERELLAKELKSGQHLMLGDFPFYARPVPIGQEDAKRLLTLCATEQTFRPLTGEKACGGFHPDWCLLWRGPAGECRVLLCFGCCEARLQCGDRTELRTDLDSAVQRELVALMKPYRTNRPPATGDVR